jgi:hypothetical protein
MNMKLKVLGAWTIIGVLLTVLPRVGGPGSGFLALMIWPVYLISGMALTAVSLIDARRQEYRPSGIVAAFALVAICAGLVFLTPSSRVVRATFSFESGSRPAVGVTSES